MTNEAIWKAIDLPEPLMSDRIDLSPEDAQIVALLRMLRSVDVPRDELRSLAVFLRESRSSSEKIMCLRRLRFSLLTRIHEYQQALDTLDGYTDRLSRAPDQTGG